jgi:predicted chitinase
MNAATFFAAIRPAFGNRLSQPQVDGMQAILDAARAAKVTDPHHVAHILAHVRRETGGYMSPIKETVYPSHKNKNPTDAEVMQRLERAWSRGQLPWVKKPYWRDGEFGRGQIQLTHAKNRAKFGITDRDDLLKLPVSARVAVVGMRDGLFTGKKLSDYTFPAALDAPPKMNPRRIVNGQDGSDAEVAKFHRQFHAALVKAGWSIDQPSTNHRRTIDKPAEAPKKPAQRAFDPKASTPQKEAVSGLAGGLTGGGVVLALVAFWDGIATALGKIADFYHYLTPWN